MPSAWFRVKKVGTGGVDDPYRPDLDTFDVDGFAGQVDTETGQTPQMVTKVVAPELVLEEIDNSPQATRLSSVPKDALDQMLGQERTVEEWNQAFNIGGV